jgi:hypothetical protein
MRFAATVIGGIAGLALVRFMFLGPLEVVAWELFWTTIGSGKLAASFKAVVTSSTFIKSFAGFAVGAVLGFLLTRGRGRSAPVPSTAEPVKESRSLYRDPDEEVRPPSLYKRCPECGAVRDRSVKACDLCNYEWADTE